MAEHPSRGSWFSLAAVGVGIAGAAFVLVFARTHIAATSQSKALPASQGDTSPLSQDDSSVGLVLTGPTPASMADLASGWRYPHDIVVAAVVSDVVHVGPAATLTPDPVEIAQYPEFGPYPPRT